MMEKPNILMMSLDSLRKDFTSVYDSKEDTTPFLKSFSEEGTVFTNAVSPSIWTLAVHASLFTGLYPAQHQLTDKGQTLGNHETLAQTLAASGYDTQAFAYNGWLLQGDTLRGFDTTQTSQWARPDGISRYPNIALGKLRQLFYRRRAKDSETVSEAVDWLTSTEGPFFGFIHLMGPHYPYSPHYDDYLEYGDSSLPELRRMWKIQSEVYNNPERKYLYNNLLPKEIEELRNLYRGEIRRTDRIVEEIIQKFRESSPSEFKNTVFIIFGDHGELFGEGGILGHNFSMSNHLHQVPLVIHDSENRFDGFEDNLTQLNDLYPTLASMCNVDVPDTRSQNIFREDRKTAYVHYEAPDSVYSRLKEGIEEAGGSMDDLPPQEYYALWRGPDENAVWTSGDEEQLVGNNSGLISELINHLENLDKVERQSNRKLTDDVMKNLEDMGYL